MATPPPDPPAGRVFSEREVAQIIERAVEQQEESRRAVPEHGLTLDEIERLGREVGIDPAFLRAAAAEVGRPGRTLGRQASQTHTHVVVERTLPGPLADEAWEDAVVLMEERFGADASAMFGRAGGGVRQVGRMQEWTHLSNLGVTTKVSLTPRGDRTRLRMTQHVGYARPAIEGVVYGAILTLVLGAVPFILLMDAVQPALAVAVAAVLFPLLSVLVFHLDRQWRAKKLRALDALADELAPLLAAPAEASRTPEALADPSPEVSRRPAALSEASPDISVEASDPGARLDLDALGDPEASDEAPVPARRRARS